MTKMTSGKNVEVENPHWIEWLTGLVSAVIVLTVIVWIAKDVFEDQDVTPDLAVIGLVTEHRSNGFQVLFEVSNSSSATASQVSVNAEILDGSNTIEKASTILDYVPGKSKARGGVIFRNDPTGRINFHVSAFNEP